MLSRVSLLLSKHAHRTFSFRCERYNWSSNQHIVASAGDALRIRPAMKDGTSKLKCSISFWFSHFDHLNLNVACCIYFILCGTLGKNNTQNYKTSGQCKQKYFKSRSRECTTDLVGSFWNFLWFKQFSAIFCTWPLLCSSFFSNRESDAFFLANAI